MLWWCPQLPITCICVCVCVFVCVAISRTMNAPQSGWVVVVGLLHSVPCLGQTFYTKTKFATKWSGVEKRTKIKQKAHAHTQSYPYTERQWRAKSVNLFGYFGFKLSACCFILAPTRHPHLRLFLPHAKAWQAVTTRRKRRRRTLRIA